jgi:hydrogenase expression/formation protein HypC
MCLAFPARVTSLGTDGTATVSVRGRLVQVALLAVADGPVGPGDWLLVHSGIAVARLDDEEAAARGRLFEETEETGEQP